jgi:hypothetical protein
LDRLQDNDGIGKQHPDPECQSSERDYVQGDIGRIHEKKCNDDGNGYGSPDDQSAKEAFQKVKQNKDGQYAPDKGGLPDFLDRVFDEF